ncbi:hypothetical protein M407DRAFT_83498 [Tulasnella calospora MUT 4182]|uniref:PARP catalytic domain-containing protein n=1 Tax=Tulasnella calospora MUT 4182 TaxID=1051891 RepID=A0A0C3PVB2_9AGAM|nr:hypothetical protein M407DRAFT_83498 [Tulasnella calospora MUT 4182]
MAGNEWRRWHGTSRLCNVGDDPENPALCVRSGCSLCSILRTSFQVSEVNPQGQVFRKFGKGIYTSHLSSKAFDYAVNGGSASQYSMIMLNNVIVGRGYKLTQDSMGVTGPPSDYHSMLTDWSYQVVVYNDDAIRPSWLVVYKN